MIENREPVTTTYGKCATTKYVSWYWKSAGTSASIRPEKPPIVNRITNEIAHSIGVSNVIEPFHIVDTQLNTFTPVGIAISIVEYIKNNSPPSGMPTVNMGWPRTMK